MGFASHLAFKSALFGPNTWQEAKTLYSTSLLLNFAWMPTFFSFRKPVLALADISLLWLDVAFTTKRFYDLDTRAGYLMLPYLAWLSYATYINAGVVYLNEKDKKSPSF